MNDYLFSILHGFIPILLIYGYICHNELFSTCANTTLGKLVAITLTVFYLFTTNFVYGAIVAISCFTFYQTDVMVMSPDNYYRI